MNALTEQELDRFATLWIRAAAAFRMRPDGKGVRIPEQLQHTQNQLMDWVRSDPAIALDVCARVAELTDNEQALAFLGAMPLEEILCIQGDEVLPRFLKEAKANPRFRTALRGIWPQSAAYWNRFESIRDRLELPLSERPTK